MIENNQFFTLNSTTLNALKHDNVNFFKTDQSFSTWEWADASAYAAEHKKEKCLVYFIKSKKEMDFNICNRAIIGKTLHLLIGKKIQKNRVYLPDGTHQYIMSYMTVWGNDVSTAIRLHRNKYIPFLIKHTNQIEWHFWWYIDAVHSNNFWAISYLKLHFKFNNKCVDYCKNKKMLLHLYQHGAVFRRKHVSIDPKFFYYVVKKVSLSSINVDDDVNIFEEWQYSASEYTRHRLYIKLKEYFKELIYKMEIIAFPFPIMKIILKYLLYFPIHNDIVFKAKKEVGYLTNIRGQ
jgi:hypothetical protein